jgi:hypothetical protein
MSGAHLPLAFIGNAHTPPRLNDNRSIRRHMHRRPRIESKSATGRSRRWNIVPSDHAPACAADCSEEPSNRPREQPDRDIPTFARPACKDPKEIALTCRFGTTPLYADPQMSESRFECKLSRDTCQRRAGIGWEKKTGIFKVSRAITLKATGFKAARRLSISISGWRHKYKRRYAAASGRSPERRGPRPASEEGKLELTEAPCSSEHGRRNSRRLPLQTAVEGVPREARKREPHASALPSSAQSHTGLTISTSADFSILPTVP